MVVKEYNSARAFLDDYESVLIEHEPVSQLVLYSAYHCYRDQVTDNALFGAVLEEENIYLIFCNVMPYNLVIYVEKSDNILQSSIALADFFAKNHITINGLNTKYDLCQSFVEQYKKYVSCTFVEKLGLDIMEIRQVNEVKPVDGAYRLALPEEAKLVAEWMIEFQMEALTSEMDYEAALQKATKLIEEGKIHFYEDIEQKVVSMAVAARKLAHGIAITYVFTPEEYRGKGYAAANIYYLSKELLEQGYEFCTIFVDKKNPLSFRAYEKVGYKVVDSVYEYKVVPT
ncbi:MAG: GNAT family N-acetyltransferase [Herbinix sp.]|nr:GNAT family N-acetyltransferase [Herbinix sp.]